MSLIMMKKIYLLAFVLFSCGSKHDSTQVTPTDPNAPQQYGTPFAGVPDAQNIVMYEVNIRAYSAAGDFQGVIDRLDNIKALGINTIWLMPIYPVGQLKSAGGLGSPYAVKDYLGVNPEFGNLDKLRELVQKAHDRNMAVILDWVANHTSWDNAWIQNKSWYSQDAAGNIIIPPNTNWTDVAELNYDNADMRKAMIAAMKYWVLEANIDGFRCDAADFVPADFWKQALDELKAIKTHQLIFLAEGSTVAEINAGFQMNYAWDFYTNMKAVYGQNKSASSIFTTHAAEYSVLPVGAKKLRYTTNHDVCAYEGSPVELYNGVPGALSASVITVFTSSVPLIYSSQEVGRATELPFFTRDPIDWTANPAMEKQYEQLFTIYNGTQTFTKGTLKSYANDDVAVFKRVYNDEQYLVLVNVRGTQKTYTLDAELQNTTWTSATDAGTITLSTQVTLDAYSYLILKNK
jgi:1,4-alpha-glucan branching enzyme